jgi:hypothetical protein
LAFVEVDPEPARVDAVHLLLRIAHDLAVTLVVEDEPAVLVGRGYSRRTKVQHFSELLLGPAQMLAALLLLPLGAQVGEHPVADDVGVSPRHRQGSGERQASDEPAFEDDRLVDPFAHRRRAGGRLGRHLEGVDLAAHDAGGTLVDVAEALARGRGEDAPALAHEGDGHAGQLACYETTDLLEEGDVETGAFSGVGAFSGRRG